MPTNVRTAMPMLSLVSMASYDVSLQGGKGPTQNKESSCNHANGHRRTEKLRKTEAGAAPISGPSCVPETAEYSNVGN